jgi:hypothetical protein
VQVDSNRIPAVIVTALGAAAIGPAGCGGTAQAKKLKTSRVRAVLARRFGARLNRPASEPMA